MMIVIEEMQKVVAKSDEKKRGDLASKGFDPCLEPVQAFGRTKDTRRAKERGSRHPQKFSSQNEGLIAGAISLRTLRCRVALNIHTRLCTCMHVCVCVQPEAPYVPARAVKHRRQDYTGVSPVPDVLSRWPLVLPSLFSSLLAPRRARLATLSRGKLDETLRERRGGASVNLASKRSHFLIVIPRKFAKEIGIGIIFFFFSK